MTLQFDINWLDAPGVEGPDAHVWADLGVSLGGRPLDAVDVRDRLLRPRFATSLLPLAEWVIAAWPRLTEERAGPSPGAGAAHGWASHHDLRFGRGGGPMPSVEIRRLSRDHMRLMAHEDAARAPGVSLSFYQNVEVLAPTSSVIRELARMVEVVLDRLRSRDPWLFEDFSTAWSAACSPHALAAGRLGFSGERLAALEDDDRAALDVLARDARLMAICEALAGPGVVARLDVARTVAAVLPGADVLAPESEAWRRVRVGTASDAPWTVGWTAASQFRDKASMSPLAPPGGRLPDLLASQFAWPVERQLMSMPTRVRGLDMITVTAAGRLPLSVTAVTAPEARRFRLAKSLYFALCGDGAPGLVVDSVRMPRHSEANAFAAELLAPVAFVSSHAPSDRTWEPEDITRVATACAVDPRVVEHQIENRGLGLLAG